MKMIEKQWKRESNGAMWGKHNIWGGALEVHGGEDAEDDEEEQNHLVRGLDGTAYLSLSCHIKQSWLLRPDQNIRTRKTTTFLNSAMLIFLAFVGIFLLLVVIMVKFMPRHCHRPLYASGNYTPRPPQGHPFLQRPMMYLSLSLSKAALHPLSPKKSQTFFLGYKISIRF